MPWVPVCSASWAARRPPALAMPIPPPLKASNIAWTEANLVKWSASPGRMVPGTKMFFLPASPARTSKPDLAAYLKTLK